MSINRFRPFVIHLMMWIVLLALVRFLSFDFLQLLIYSSPILVIDLWLSFSLGLMFRKPIKREVSESIGAWIFEEEDNDGYPVRWLRTSMTEDRPLAIVIHGWNSRAINMEGRARIYLDQGYNVILFEMRAHGGNRPVEHWAAMHICHDFEEMLKLYSSKGWLDNGFIVHGHSMGGFIAQRGLRETLVTSTNLKGVILESPVTSYSLINNVTCKYLLIPKAIHPWMMRRLLRHYNSINKLRYQIQEVQDLESPDWGLPNAPTLLVQAKHDSTLGEEHWKHLVEVHSLTQSKFKYHIVENLKHSQERENEERDQLILTWMKEESLLF